MMIVVVALKILIVMARLMAMMSAKKDEGCPLVLVSWGHGENREEVDDDDAVSRLKKLDVTRGSGESISEASSMNPQCGNYQHKASTETRTMTVTMWL